MPLSRLIDVVNQRFGTDFTQGDQLFFDQIVETAIADENLRKAAAVNPDDKFKLVFGNLLEQLFADRMDQNEEIFIRFMNDPAFQHVVTDWMASEAYRKLRADSDDDAEPSDSRAPVLPFRVVQPNPAERYVTCVPLVPLEAAAGTFGKTQHVEDNDWTWVEVGSGRRLRPGMFVARVVGRSMEPAIPDGAWCLFAAPVTGTRMGKTVLVQLRDVLDPETGARYTVKRYESEKSSDGDAWRHATIRLKPLNPDFEPIVLPGTDEDQVQVIAEFVGVVHPA